MRLKVLEKDIKKAILDYLRTIPKSYFRVIHIGSIGERSNPSAGISDILGLIAGKFVAIEVKRPGGRPTDKQVSFLREVERAGGVAVLAYSVQDVQDALEPILAP